jgi:hypothetical protein
VTTRPANPSRSRAQTKHPTLDHEAFILQRLVVYGRSQHVIDFYGELEIPGHLGISLERARMVRRACSAKTRRRAADGLILLIPQPLSKYIKEPPENAYRAEKLRIALEIAEGVKVRFHSFVRRLSSALTISISLPSGVVDQPA